MAKQYKAVKVAQLAVEKDPEPEVVKEKVQTQVLRIVNEKKFNLDEVVKVAEEQNLVTVKPVTLKPVTVKPVETERKPASVDQNSVDKNIEAQKPIEIQSAESETVA